MVYIGVLVDEILVMITAVRVPGSLWLFKYDPESCSVPLKEAHTEFMLVYLRLVAHHLGAANE